MNKPQLENGYTQISNELLDAFANIRISGEAWQCLNVIIRKTYGFKKIEDWISLSQFVDATGMKKESVCRALKKLISMNIINKNVNSADIKYGIQKDYSKWKPLTKKLTNKAVNINNNDNEINNNDTRVPLTKKITQINNNDNPEVTILLKSGVTKKLHTKALILKKDLQKKVLPKKELLFKIKTIKKEFNDFVKSNFDFVIEQAQIVFSKPYYTSSDDLKSYDKFMDYWIRKEVDKMRIWIDEDTDKSINLKNYENFITEWFKREKKYPAYITAEDETIYYEMKRNAANAR